MFGLIYDKKEKDDATMTLQKSGLLNRKQLMTGFKLITVRLLARSIEGVNKVVFISLL